MRFVPTVVLSVAVIASTPAAAGPALPPPVVYLVEAVGEGNTVDLGAIDVGSGLATTVLADLPSGVDGRLAVDAASRRWAITFHQRAGGAPLVIEGKPLTEPDGIHAVLTGQLDTPGVIAMAGDPRCHSRATACFETPQFFAAGGRVLVTRSEGNSWWMWNRRVIAAGARPAAIVDRALAARGSGLAVGSDGTRVVYQGKKGGLYVTGWRPLSTARARLVQAARAPVATPPLLMSDVALIAGHVFYFRRDPADQRIGVIAAWDLAGKREREVMRASLPSPLWFHRFLATSRGTVVFQDDVGFERADIVELTLATWEVRRRGGDVRELLDVSPDGRFALAAAYAEPDAARRGAAVGQELVVLDLELGVEVARASPPARLPVILDARFVAPAPGTR